MTTKATTTATTKATAKIAHTFNLADLFESVADVVPEREALIAGPVRLTFAQLDERSTRLAHHLASAGIGAGDHVGLYLHNGHEFIEAILASFKLRAVPININYRYVEAELRYLCANAELKALVYPPELAERVQAIDLPSLRLRLTVGDEYERALAAAAPTRDFAPRSSDDRYIIYTGGTTGMPRGVVWRHEDVFFAGLQGGNPGGEPLTRPEEVAPLAASGEKALTFLPAAPFIHGAAQWAAFIALNAGGKCVISPGPRFDAVQVAELLAKEQVNTLTLVGDAMARPLAEVLTARPELDISSLIVIASAGAIFSRSVQSELAARLPSTLILNNFGASETGHQGNVADNDGARPKFIMGDSTAVFDDSFRPVAAGSGIVGRVARRGHIPLGYYNDPEKTKATFIEIDGERWVMPGDLALVEADGSITVLGRGAVCINSGGEKIFPEEVEEALKAHPAVLDAVVVGVPDSRWGERVAALVQPRDSLALGFPTLVELDAHCRPRIAGYKIPRELHLVGEIARHPSGKPDYRWAKAEALARQGDPRHVGWELGTITTDGAWAQRRRLTRAIQQLIERCVRLDVADDACAGAIADVAATLEAQLTRLDALPARGSRAAFVDGSYQRNRAQYMDRGPLIGLSNPLAPPMQLSHEGEMAIARVTFTHPYEGAPDFVHGGVLASAFDQVFGYLGVLRGVPALTGSLTVRYRKPTPIGVELRFEAEAERSEGRKSFVRGRCIADGEVTADAEALFVSIGAEWFERLMQAQ
jgi:acyl-CoA synthetase (AMP-forming)/AMP-acid ligase II/acyl-coenzyme A thioesterase PaaI-like protein